MSIRFQSIQDQYAYIQQVPLVGSVVVHYKENKQYLITGLSIDEKTKLPRVEYVSVDAPIGTIPWSRELQVFMEEVACPDGKNQQRFTLTKKLLKILPSFHL